MTGTEKSNPAETTARWSARVTRQSDALDLEPDVFTLGDPHEIAASLKRSARVSKRRKGTPYQSAMSMLTFYINRAGRGLPARQREVLDRPRPSYARRLAAGDLTVRPTTRNFGLA